MLREIDLSDGEYAVGLMEIIFPHDFQRNHTYSGEETICLRYSSTEYEHFRIPNVKYTGPINPLRKFCHAHAYAWELEEYKTSSRASKTEGQLLILSEYSKHGQRT